jgi:hypothetical protein
VTSFSQEPRTVQTRNGLSVIPDQGAAGWRDDRSLAAFIDRPPADALRANLDAIEDRYGAPTAALVATQLEYARR